MIKRPIIIGIVGGIASGKSEVANLLVQHGAARINADELGHSLLTTDEKIKDEVVRLFGESILDQSQQIDRKRIASQVFGNDERSKALLDQLEAILHPAIRRLAEERLARLHKQSDVSLIVLDAPLLIEAGWSAMCDEIVFVDTPLERRQELAALRGWSADELVKREAAQLALSEKRAASTRVIVNEGDLADLRRKIKTLVTESLNH
jgi:dephospho-CoA kinase